MKNVKVLLVTLAIFCSYITASENPTKATSVFNVTGVSFCVDPNFAFFWKSEFLFFLPNKH